MFIAQLWQHLSNMNVIQRIEELFMQDREFCTYMKIKEQRTEF